MSYSPDPTLLFFFFLVGDCSYPSSEITNNGLQKRNHHQQPVKEQANKLTPAIFQEFL